MSTHKHETEIMHGMGDLGKSRSQKKRESTALQAIGEQLTKLSDSSLEELELTPDLRNAIKELRSIKKHEARRRQNQLIGRHMRELDESTQERISVYLQNMDKQRQGATDDFHRVEELRDALLNPDTLEKTLNEISGANPGAEIKKIRHMAINAAAERLSGKNKMYRELFRYLKNMA